MKAIGGKRMEIERQKCIRKLFGWSYTPEPDQIERLVQVGTMLACDYYRVARSILNRRH